VNDVRHGEVAPDAAKASPYDADATSAVASDALAAEPVLRAEGLAVRYPGGGLGIEDVSISVWPGSLVAILGPNGAGKTTALRAMTGFLRGERTRIIRGEVMFRAERITGCRPDETARRGVALVPDRGKIFANLTVRENLEALGRVPTRARRTEILTQLEELFPFVLERPKAIAGHLSGGQQQMLAIARALMADPDVLLLDDMTLGLHVSLRPPLFDAMRAVASMGTAVIVVDESVELALAAVDYAYVLARGTNVAEGRPADLKDNRAVAAYLGAPSV
jgi:branched-chain amino acid transport system ATP-binding protein